MPPMSLEEHIITEGRRLGFAAVGFAEAKEAETLGIYNRWLDSGGAAQMSYLARHAELRVHVNRLAPGTRSIIVVAARYPVNPEPAQGGIASYARGRDYHKVMRKKLKQLVAFLRAHTEIQVARICVDSAPVLEREWAIRAGIGWRGRQGQLVHETFGCCFVLGEILVDLELHPSRPRSNRCGSCRRCIDACPTGAIDANGLVESRRCRSYLTIEHDGDIPTEDQSLLGQALFGCDLCTASCPWNRFGEALVMPELTGDAPFTPEDFLTMTEEVFQERFQGTPLYRTGLARLQRNAAIALKNRR